MIGAGQHSSNNIYPYFHFLKGKASVVANCDIDLNRAKEIGQLFGINQSYTDFKKMVAEQKPDGAIICINDKWHAQLAIELMELGVHVYVEKPHAPSLEASKKMLETSIKTRRIHIAGYKKRFSPAYQKAKAAIDAPEFGKPGYLNVFRSRGGIGGTKEPDYIWQWGCHATNLVTYLYGQVKTVQSLKSPGSWDSLICNLQFSSGAVGTLTFCSPGKTSEEMLALGDKMHLVKVTDSIYYTKFYGNEPVGGHWPNFITGYTHSAVEEGFVPELQEFVAAIQEKRQPDSNIVHSTWTSALQDALMRSVETGKAEEVEQFEVESLPVPEVNA